MKARQTGVYIAVIALALIFLILAFTITPLSELTVSSDAAYPIFIASMCAVFAIWIVISEERKRKRGNTADSAEEEAGDRSGDEQENKIFSVDALVLMGMIAVYGLLLIFTGYIIATLLFTIVAITYLYKKDYKTGLLVGFISTFIIVLVFKYGFSVILP